MKVLKVGGITILGFSMMFASESGREVDAQDFQSVLMRADKIVVYRGEGSSRILFSSTKFEDIEEFRKVVAIDPSQGEFYCACMGTPVIRLYQREKELLTITNHHGRSIRTSLWANNVRLSQGRARHGPQVDANVSQTQSAEDRSLVTSQNYLLAQR